MDLTPLQARVLGSLLEKEVTVPATYPLTMNALLSACNQASGRDPQMEVDRWAADDALESLKNQHLVRVVHASHGARTVKYRQVLDEYLGLVPPQRAVLTVLLLRGPQTPGELRSRTERLHPFASRDEVEQVLGQLSDREEPLVRILDRRTGQKEARWTELLSDPEPERREGEEAASQRSDAPEPPSIPAEVAPLAPLIGDWSGAGAGEYPTIAGFTYTQEIAVRPVPGKPVLAYGSRTAAADDGRPLHAETGWLRPVSAGRVELVVAAAPGVVEVCEGLLEPSEGGGVEMLLSSTGVVRTTTAKEVTATERRFTVTGDRLDLELAMAAVGEPLTHHLRARLRRS